ncbi:PTS system mannose/fructose/sorbose family IIA subunit [endosymbiont of Euscepes postfasciatus]|uniref:PTS sugar transporter subunit IIA n=1 Tax=endosymbiont of Euscepes postfasciatus TaxID=650377 RepID=UPI000DC70376|nr:hypothetical protein [endosymbiont of Euscepes postfasciatus]BBA84733.1 PTS system mannose/fructose/sorbose family IIA subunit [endosymbiont of Euscepes postfasciatus]
MKIAILLCTHGRLSIYLMKSLEIILGKQNNFSCIYLDSDNDSNKYINNIFVKKIEELNIKNGIICVTDIFGGSLFNISYNILKEKKYKFSIISGINLPMLIDFFMNKNNKSIKTITKSLIEIGKNSIKNINNF